MRFTVVIFSIIWCLIQVACESSDNTDHSQVEMTDLVKEEPRKKQQQDVFSRILPMLATPFILQTTLLPMVIMSMKFMLLNSMFLGKLGIFLWIINIIRNRMNDGGALYSHNVNVKHNDYPGHFNEVKQHVYSEHYRSAGDEVYGAPTQRRKKRK